MFNWWCLHTSLPLVFCYVLKWVVWTGSLLVAAGIYLIFMSVANQEMLYSQTNQKTFCHLHTVWLQIFSTDLYQHTTDAVGWSVSTDYPSPPQMVLNRSAPWGSRNRETNLSISLMIRYDIWHLINMWVMPSSPIINWHVFPWQGYSSVIQDQVLYRLFADIDLIIWLRSKGLTVHFNSQNGVEFKKWFISCSRWWV